MAKYIDKDTLVADIEKVISGLRRNCNPNPLGNTQECLAAAEIEALNLIKDSLDTLEVKEIDLKSYDKLTGVFSIYFARFLDENCSEGKIRILDGECFDIYKAFDAMDFTKLFRYVKRYLKTQKGEEV